MTEPRGARASRQRLTGKGTDRERRWLLLWTKHIGGGKALVPKCIARPASFMVVNKRKTKHVPIRCLWERGKLRGVLELGLWGHKRPPTDPAPPLNCTANSDPFKCSCFFLLNEKPYAAAFGQTHAPHRGDARCIAQRRVGHVPLVHINACAHRWERLAAPEHKLQLVNGSSLRRSFF